MKILLLPALIIFAIQSCTFKQDVTFNKNWSGEMACVIDMKEVSSMLGEGDTKFDLLEEEDSKKKFKELEETPGIKKLKVKETEAGVYSISYQFKNMDALNKSANVLFADEKEVSVKDFTYFKLQDKQNLYFTMPFGGEFAPETEEDPDNAMAQSFAYELTLKFPKKIKAIETQNGAVLSEDKTKVILKTDILTMTNKDFKPGMLITFE